MNVQQLKRWHWLGISLILGLLLGILHGSLDQYAPTRSMTPAQFESMLLTPPLKPGDNFIRDIVIFPTKDDSNLVRFEALTPTGKLDQWEYVPRQMEAPIPYPPTANTPVPGGMVAGNYTVNDYLQNQEKQNPQIFYTFAWWATPRLSLVIWTIGSVLVIGIFFPTLINLLLGAGFGPKKAEPMYDLNRFAPESQEIADSRFAARNDPAQLDKVICDLQKNLTDSEPFTLPETTQAAPINSPSLPLRSKDDTTLIFNEGTESTEKHFEGKYYPTALSVHPPSVDNGQS